MAMLRDIKWLSSQLKQLSGVDSRHPSKIKQWVAGKNPDVEITTQKHMYSSVKLACKRVVDIWGGGGVFVRGVFFSLFTL